MAATFQLIDPMLIYNRFSMKVKLSVRHQLYNTAKWAYRLHTQATNICTCTENISILVYLYVICCDITTVIKPALDKQ